MGRKAQRRPKTHTPVTRAPTLIQQTDPMEFKSACDGSLSDSDNREADLTSMDEVISFNDIIWYVVSNDHLRLIQKFPVTFRGCTPARLEHNFPATADLCKELTQQGHHLTDGEVNQVVDVMRLSGPRAFTAIDLRDYIVSENHDRLIRTFIPFVDCTPDVLKQTFPLVTHRYRKMRKDNRRLTRMEVSELVDLMTSSKSKCSE